MTYYIELDDGRWINVDVGIFILWTGEKVAVPDLEYETW